MHPLPNYEEAVIEDSKFVSYALDPQSGRGQHKAWVLDSAWVQFVELGTIEASHFGRTPLSSRDVDQRDGIWQKV